MATEKRDWVNVTAAAKIAGVSRTIIYRKLEAGKFGRSAVRGGRGWLIDPVAIPLAMLSESSSSASVSEVSGATPINGASKVPEGIPSKAVSDAVQAHYKAQLARLEYEQKEENLADVQVMYSRMFEMGKRLRDNILNVPARIIDELRSLDDRTEALNFLKDQLIEVLERSANEFEKLGGSMDEEE